MDAVPVEGAWNGKECRSGHGVTSAATQGHAPRCHRSQELDPTTLDPVSVGAAYGNPHAAL